MEKRLVLSEEMADVAMEEDLLKGGDFPTAYPAIVVRHNCGCWTWKQKYVTAVELKDGPVKVTLSCSYAGDLSVDVEFADFASAKPICDDVVMAAYADAGDDDYYGDDEDDDYNY